MTSSDEFRERSPVQAGYRWPAEWEPHTATWLTWPHNPATWPDRLEHAEREYAEFVRVLAEFEPVRILVPRDVVRRRAQDLLTSRKADLAEITFVPLASNDSWIRDYGPVFLTRPEEPRLAAVSWRYNAWGGKYPPWEDDDRVADSIARWCGCPSWQGGIVLEGGAIEGNGQGTVLTTESCLLNPNRNPQLTRGEVESRLADFLAARRVCWLSGEGVLGDDTDGHIDQLARFVGPATVVAAASDDPADPQHRPLAENIARLQAARTADGQPLEVVRLPMPSDHYCQGQRLPASYCNFYIANGAVLVPQFDDPADSRAVELLADLFPKRRVLGVAARELVWGLGAFHCLTQQQPRESP